jgi:hypothetical protein
MPQGWSSQSGDELDDIGAWMARRNARLALRPEADSVARNLWNQSIQNGDDLYAGNPSDLTAIGLAALGGAGSHPNIAGNDDGQSGDDGASDPSPGTGAGLARNGAAASGARAHDGGPYPSNPVSKGSRQEAPIFGNQGPGLDRVPPSGANDPWVSELDVVGEPTPLTPHRGFLDRLNHSLPARVAGGVVGYVPGLFAGVARGGWHALEGVDHGLNFAGSLFFPEGRAKAWDETKTATHNALQYGRSVAANPSRLADDAISAGTTAAHSLVPFTTMADTGTGEIGHEFGIGMNGGETLLNVAGLFAAPEVVGGVNAARTFAATREANIAKFMGQGLDEQTARYLSKSYKGDGDHALFQKSQKSILGFKAPWLKKAPIPQWFMDGPLNVSRPRGLSQGDFYEYHYGVDPNYYGGSLRRSLNGGKGWSGNRLGIERYSGPRRIWARIPPIWKDYYSGVASGEGLSMLPEDTSETP